MNNKIIKNTILLIQMILTIFGTILAIILLFRTLKTPSFLGIMGSIAYLISYIAIIIYSIINYNKKEDIYFQGVIYAYAAVLGIQILQSGNYISDYGLEQNIVVLINIFNLISFANIIKFADNLHNFKKAISYISIAVVLKLLIEVYLIVKMLEFIEFIHILMSLSIPILGITIILAYIYKIKKLEK